MEANILVIIVIISLIVIIGWEAFNQLSWGKLRKLESENNNYAPKVENWLKHKASYITVFRFLLFFLIAIIGSLVFQLSQKFLIGCFSFIASDSLGMDILLHIIPALIITLVLILLTEAVLRLFVIRYDIKILIVVMPFIKMLNNTFLYPLLLFIKIIFKIIKYSRTMEDNDKPSTEDEIMSLIEKDYSVIEDENALEEDEKQMIKGIFELDDTIVREIMTPRVDVVALPVKSGIQEAIELFTESGHSRIPVYDNTVDEITGIILAKDFLDTERLKNRAIKDLAHKPKYIPETKSTLSLLNELKGSRNHFSVVIDEYGGTAGIVTMEDILEEIVGEIHDEHETKQEADIHIDKDGTAVIEARTLLDEVEELFDIKLPEDEDVDTIGGLISAMLGRIPDPGEEVNVEDLLNVKVLKADKRRVLTLKVRKIN